MGRTQLVAGRGSSRCRSLPDDSRKKELPGLRDQAGQHLRGVWIDRVVTGEQFTRQHTSDLSESLAEQFNLSWIGYAGCEITDEASDRIVTHRELRQVDQRCHGEA